MGSSKEESEQGGRQQVGVPPSHYVCFNLTISFYWIPGSSHTLNETGDFHLVLAAFSESHWGLYIKCHLNQGREKHWRAETSQMQKLRQNKGFLFGLDFFFLLYVSYIIVGKLGRIFLSSSAVCLLRKYLSDQLFPFLFLAFAAPPLGFSIKQRQQVRGLKGELSWSLSSSFPVQIPKNEATFVPFMIPIHQNLHFPKCYQWFPGTRALPSLQNVL